MRALGAEPGSWQNQVSAVGASACDRSGALLTEFRVKPVFVLAPQTLHLSHQLRVATGSDNLLPAAMHNNQ
jgi:hypothetical protein